MTTVPTGLNEKLGTSFLAQCHMKQSWQETQVSVPGQGQDEETDKLISVKGRRMKVTWITGPRGIPQPLSPAE